MRTVSSKDNKKTLARAHGLSIQVANTVWQRRSRQENSVHPQEKQRLSKKSGREIGTCRSGTKIAGRSPCRAPCAPGLGVEGMCRPQSSADVNQHNNRQMCTYPRISRTIHEILVHGSRTARVGATTRQQAEQGSKQGERAISML
jgi:hypothetical protein